MLRRRGHQETTKRRRWERHKVRVLVVEDEELLASAIAEGLRQEAFAVDVVHDGEAALERLAKKCRGEGPTTECPILEELDREEKSHAHR